MLTIETIEYRNQVSKVWEEVSSILEEKYLYLYLLTLPFPSAGNC